MDEKRIAIIQGFQDFHHEMLGYVIEYCIQRTSQILFDVYVTQSRISETYEKLFNTIFGIDITWKPIQSLHDDDYDYIVLLTDDDNSYSKLESISHKVICIDHTNVIRRKDPLHARIGTRHFPKRNQNEWALPVFTGLSLITKKDYLVSNRGKVHVCCVGVSNIPTTHSELHDWFGDSTLHVEFHFVARTIHSRHMFYNCPNIHLYENCEPDIYFEILRKCVFVLCANSDIDYEEDMMSGALPIAFTFGCKLIIPPPWQANLQFKSALTYSIDKKLDLTDKSYHSLEPVFEELGELTNHRNSVFDKYILSSK